MKIEFDDEEILIYLKKEKNKEINYTNEKELEIFLKNLFIKLSDIYNIKINGYYNIYVYIDKLFGLILKIKKEEFEYYDLMDNQVEMKIILKDSKFMYMIDDLSNINKELFNIYKFNNNIYLLPIKDMSNIKLAELIERSTIIWDSEEIIKKGNIINKFI